MTSVSTRKATDNREHPEGISVAVLELLASRICHDLISPVGAVNNGVEFLEDMGADAGEEAISLIAMSAKNAAARLQAFRMAYGAGGRDPNIKPEDVKKTFTLLTEIDGKIAQDWDPHADLGFNDRPQGYCKILMGALMLAQECLPKGGSVTVESGGPGTTRIVATGPDAGPRAQVEDALGRTVAVESLDPRLVHPYALGVLAASYGINVRIAEKAPNRLVITLSLPA